MKLLKNKSEISVVKMQKLVRGFLGRRAYHKKALTVLLELDLTTDPRGSIARQPTIVRENYESIQKFN